ncbi:hypothetical protein OFB97_30430, partial [Escherichia coli]|nr:hypothetical protein [Escherichia coli]
MGDSDDYSPYVQETSSRVTNRPSSVGIGAGTLPTSRSAPTQSSAPDCALIYSTMAFTAASAASG